MKSFVFFDLDGTLLDSMPYHAKAWIEVLSQYGLKFDEREVYIYEGAIEFETVREIFSKKGVEIKKEFFYDLLKKQKETFLIKFARFVKPFPEVPDLLENLKKERTSLALVTSSHAEVLEKVLPKDFKKFFALILTGDRISKRKPHPEPYLKALEFLKASVDDSLVVENSPAGVMSAKGANLFCIAITTTLPESYLDQADLIVKNHLELKKVLLDGKGRA